METADIYISGYFTDDDIREIEAMEDEIKKRGITLKKRNLTGHMFQSALDFMDLEIVAISHELLTNLIYSGCYDILKSLTLKLWSIAKKDTSSRVPFTIEIHGIPYNDSLENIKCKVEGKLSKKQKDRIIDNAFKLAQQVESHQFELLSKSIYYDAFKAHLFKYNSENDTFTEIDLDKEIKKKMCK